MQLTCPCLNITINVVVEEESFNDSLIKLETIKQQFGEDVAGDPFFAMCDAGDIAQFILSENGINEKLPMLIRRRSIDHKWDVRRCLVCGVDAYASRVTGDGRVLVNTKLFISDISVIDELRRSPEISPVFHVILPKKGTFPLSLEMNANGYSNGASPTVLSRSVLQSVQSCVSQYLTHEQEAMDDRIRVYIDQQQSAFERLKANVKTEKTLLLRFLAHNGAGNGNDSISSSGTMDDGFDSAVPLSPLSAASGAPSPCLVVSMMGHGGGAHEVNSPLRPKALSNPASLAGWKRKRHSGGNSIAPGLASHAEEQQDIFTFDEQVALEYAGNQCDMPIDDGDTPADGITGDDYNKRYPSVDPKGRQYGSSLPYCAPVVCGYRPVDATIPEMPAMVQDDVFDQPTGDKPKDVGASMHALALSMKCADDPERLFGERPQRRRWKTGEDRQHIRQRNSSMNYTATIIYANENHNC